MNSVAVSGRLIRDAIINENKVQVLRFLVLAQHGYDTEEGKPRQSIVPCKLFKPSEKLVDLLTSKGQGIFIEVSGRISSSSYEKNGEKRYSVEVTVTPGTLNIVKFPKKNGNNSEAENTFLDNARGN